MRFVGLKQKIHPRKINLIILFIILLALPLTVILSQEKQDLRKQASGKKDAQANTKPNIVIIMLDDVNPMDGRLFGKQTTPNIWSEILSKGINFTNFYTETSLCCPGRVGFLTGQHTQNHGVPDLDGTKFNPKVSLATELQGAGYYTILTGKYLNNYINFPLSERIPPGWDRFDALFEYNVKFYNYQIFHKDKSIDSYGSKEEDYSTDVISNWTLKRIRTAPSQKPLFLIANPGAIHTPLTAAVRHKEDARCAEAMPWNAPNVNETDVSDKPAWIRDLPNSFKAPSLRVYCEMLLSVDDMVGSIALELKKQGRFDNSLFILTSDNGDSLREHRISGKTVPYATHIPFYISWPAGRGMSPRVEGTTLSNIDLAPTLCELAGCTMGPYPNGQGSADGLSFAALLKDRPKNFTRDAILESQPVKPGNTAPSTRPAWWAIRTTEQNSQGLWHYIEYQTGAKELYNLSNGPCYLWTPDKNGDPCELENLLRADRVPSAQTKSISESLKSRLEQLKKEKGFSKAIAPKGSIDNATCSTFKGWACDPNDYSQSLNIHFYADGQAGANGTLVGITTANLTRDSAVVTKCGGFSNHGFIFNTPKSLKDGESHEVYAYAIDIGINSTYNPKLGGSPKTITCSQ